MLGKLYVVGGSDGQTSLISVEIYDPKLRTWSFGPSLNTPRANMGLAVMNGRLFAVGGFTGKAFLESIEYLAEDSNDWSIFLPPGVRSESSSIRSTSGSDNASDIAPGVTDGWVGAGILPEAMEFCSIWQHNGIVSSEDEIDSLELGLSLVSAVEKDADSKDVCGFAVVDGATQNGGGHLEDIPEFAGHGSCPDNGYASGPVWH